MASLFTDGKFQGFDSSGNPLSAGKLYSYAAGTTTPLATYTTQSGGVSNANPVILDSSGRASVWLGSSAYRMILKDSADATVWDVDNITGATGVADLSATTGPGLIGFSPSIAYAAGTLGGALVDDAINVMWYMSAAQRADVKAYTYVEDVYSVVQACLDLGQSTGRAVYAPAGGYRLSAGLSITDDLTFIGDGGVRTILKIYSASVTAVLTVAVPNNASFICGQIGGFGLVCNGGAAVCDGLVVTTTATNSAVSQSVFRDMFITNPRDGVRLDGVIYMTAFRGITVTGTVARYGWYSDSAREVIYNLFENLEVTGVAATAYAYWLRSAASEFINLTADGCCYFSSPYGGIKGLAVEGIAAATTPSVYAVQLNQVQSCKDVAIINVPNSKCQYGIDVLGASIEVGPVRCPDSGAGNQPNRLLNLHAGNSGTISNCTTDRAITDKLEAYLADSILAGFVITGCDGITDRGSSYSEGAWTPVFPASWTTSPTAIAANYIKVGRMVTATVYAQDGVCNAGATITGLPFACRATSGAAAAGACSDTTRQISASIVPSASALSNIPANTLTGTFWQLTATYFV